MLARKQKKEMFTSEGEKTNYLYVYHAQSFFLQGKPFI